jgi:hypothetical protein
MRFTHRCKTAGPFPGTLIGFNGEEMVQGECHPPPRTNSAGNVTDETDEDYAILTFSPVFQVHPTHDELSPAEYATADRLIEGDAPSIFANFKNRAFDRDTAAISFAGVTPDGIDDAPGAREDPLSCARTAIMLHGSTSMACDGRFFERAHLGMLVECIPTDSGWAPEGSETYSPPIFRAVLAEDVPGSIWFGGRNVPTVAAVSAAYEVMQRWGAGGEANNAVAIVMSLWDLAKVPSVPIKNPVEAVALRNIARVEDVLGIQANSLNGMYALARDGATARPTVNAMVNPFSIFTAATMNVDAYLLGSPRAPSIVMHVLDIYRDNMHYYFDAASPVYLRTDKTPAERRAVLGYSKATGAGEAVRIFGAAAPTREYNLGPLTHAEFVALEAVARAAGDTIGASIKDINRLREATFGELQNIDPIEMEALFGPGVQDLPDVDKVVLADAARVLAARMKVPVAMLHMQEHFPLGKTPFFMEHEHHAHMMRTVGAAGVVDAEFIDVEYGVARSATFHSVSLGAAMGGYTTVPRPFRAYDTGNPGTMNDPVVNNVAELTRVRRKRERDPDMTNHVDFRDVEFNEVMTELDKLPPMRRWIVGEFIQREGVGDDANCIRICLRKPFAL